MNNSIASSASDSDGTRQRHLARHPDRLTAGRQHASTPGSRPAARRPARRWRRAGARSCPAPAASAVADEPQQRVHRGAAGLVGQPERAGHRDRHQPGSVIGARSTYHTPSPNSARDARRDLQRPDGSCPRRPRRSASPAGCRPAAAARRSSALRAQRNSSAAPEDACATTAFGRPQRRELVVQVGMAQLHHPFGAGQIAQRMGAQVGQPRVLAGAGRRPDRSVAPDSTVWPPWARSRSRAVRLMVGPM